MIKIEQILRHSSERYFDSGTHRMIVVGKHDNRLVIIPYDEDGGTIVPVIIHASATDQIPLKEREVYEMSKIQMVYFKNEDMVIASFRAIPRLN